ncbi:MAG TPA: glycoside hydrolase family 6 protein [Acidimicrobiales bacterium]|nr:glycoside hydrolase family 6 protein [Acidimicrobiales bacterium]
MTVSRRWFPRRPRASLAVATALAALAASSLGPAAPPAAAAPGCTVAVQAQPWTEAPGQGGYTANLTITNTGDPVTGWTLAVTLPAGQSFTQGWSAAWSGGPPLTATNLDWNGNLATGASTTIGFNGRWTGAFAAPSAFTLDGTPCGGGGGPANRPPTVALTSPAAGQSFAPGAAVPLAATAADPDGPVARVEFLVDGALVATDTTAPYTAAATGLAAGSHSAAARAVDTASPAAATTSPAVSFTVTGDPGPGPGGKVDNPFAGATGYVNPAWQAQVNQAADAAGGTLGSRMRVAGRQSTAVWMDRIGAIDPPGSAMGLADHLDAARFEDGATGPSPLAIQVVIYDLPNRDCAALASNGELLIAQDGLARYRTEYIDPIRAVLANPLYRDLRIVLVIEPDSLPNLVTNVSGPQASARCIEAQQTGAYRDGVRYAVSQLSSLPNTHLYLDIAHSGWLGWPNNFDGTLGEFDRTLAAGQGGPGYDKIHGFVTNTANYTPLDEPFLPDPNRQVGSGQLLSSTFYEFNPRFDERDYATHLQAAFAARGCIGCGILIDTSRNGWGGPGRPTQVSTSTDLNTYVDQSRVDRRPHRGGWCNQDGAGIGERPTAATGTPGIDAFVWVKPPGESDGVSQPGIVDPDDPAKGFDAMCDPTAQNRYNPAFPTNALPGAPHAGRWFPAQFTMLVQNAFPALPTA